MSAPESRRREPTENEKLIGRYIRSIFGPETSVRRYADDNEARDLFLVAGADWPVKGVTSYGTIGLSNYLVPVGSKNVNLELLGACATATPHFDNVIASCAIERMRNGTPITLGSTIRGVVAQYAVSPTMEHVLFVSQFLWEGFAPQTFAGTEVHWLMAVPISESELAYVNEHGLGALEARFESEQIDVFDICRLAVA